VRGIEIGKIEMPGGVGDLRERRLLYVAMTRT
jgi:superfamily I DNA/RNA helicase